MTKQLPCILHQTVGRVGIVRRGALVSRTAGVPTTQVVSSLEEGTTTYDPETFAIEDTRFAGPISEILSGEAWGCMDITEPDAGSDMGALRCVGEQDEDGNWTVTGQKIFVTSGHGRYHFVIARTEDAKDLSDPMAGLKGLSMFLVPIYEEQEDGTKKHFATTMP